MAEFCSYTTEQNELVHVCETETSSTNEQINDGNQNKPHMTMEQNRQLTDKLLEIKQIKYQECLIYEQINRLNTEKQHLQNLLNILRAMDSNDRLRTSRHRQRRLK